MNYQKRQYVPQTAARCGGVCPKKSKIVDDITASVDMDAIGPTEPKPDPTQDSGPFQEKPKHKSKEIK